MPRLLALIPHPDDESYSFGGMLAMAARARWDCRVECATAGAAGARFDGGPADREDLARARLRELDASCSLLGTAPPRCWGLPDGGLASEPSQASRIGRLVSELSPDVVVTLGLDGAYGHPDHLALTRWVVEAWELLGREAPPLLFAAFPRGLFLPQYRACIGMMGEPPQPAAEALGAVPPDFWLPVGCVSRQKLAAISAHRSQLPRGDPERLFPPGIVRALLPREGFSLFDPAHMPAVAHLLLSLDSEV